MPDVVFLFAYIILFWQLLKLFFEGHANLAVDFAIIRGRMVGYKMLVGLLVIYLCIEVLMIILFLNSTISPVALTLEISIVMVSAAALILFSMFFLFIRFSGYPYKNNIYRAKLRKITCATLVWSLSRIFRGIQVAIQNQTLEDLISGLEKDRDNTTTIVWISVLVLVDAIPFFLVLDWSFMGIFTLEGRKPGDYEYEG